MLKDFSGGTGKKQLPANGGDTGLIPAPERFHILGAAEPMHLEPVLPNKSSHCKEQPGHHSKDVAPAGCNSKPVCSKQDPGQPQVSNNSNTCISRRAGNPQSDAAIHNPIPPSADPPVSSKV